MFEKHLWKSDILSKDAGHRPFIRSFIHVDIISVGGHGQACPNYTKQQVSKIYAIFHNFAFWAKI